ncbi:MAG: hypothetical protein LBI47_01590 [Puniceicoccales bacterium]|jgi:hypothetical protein|nr:hypothetical protein [Puniceicoccales bacterium]
MESNTRSFFSSPQSLEDYISFVSLTYLSLGAVKVGLNVVGKGLRNAASAARRIFGRGVESVSYQLYDKNSFSQAQSDKDDKSPSSASLVFPDGETMNSKLLNELRSRNSKTSPSSLALDLPANASPQTKFNATMTSRTDQIKANMDRYLGNTLELNEKNSILAEGIKEQSEKAADLKAAAALKECSANKWSAWGQCLITLGGICGTLPRLPALAAFAAVQPLAAAAGAVLGAGLIVYSCVRKGQAALITCDGDEIQAEVQLKRDEQNKNNTEISTYQNLFSTESQAYSTMFSMWQSIISAMHESMRAIAANMR